MTLRAPIVFCLITGGMASLPLPAIAADALLDRLLRTWGLTAAPQTKGIGDGADSGQIWVADLEQRTTAQLVPDDGYRSPLFSPKGDSILALRATQLVRIALRDNKIATVMNQQKLVKLVGFDRQDPDLLLVLQESAGDAAPMGLLSLKSGKISPLPYDRTASEHRRILSHMRGEDKVYGTTRVYLKTESRRGMSRMLEWTDIYLKRGDAPPRNVSTCDGVNCGQPSLSLDGRKLVFIKTSEAQ